MGLEKLKNFLKTTLCLSVSVFIFRSTVVKVFRLLTKFFYHPVENNLSAPLLPHF